MTESPSRRLWKAAETVHAVTYFSEESKAAARELGYRGFWMGYFAFRAAPLGPVGPAAVEALFNNFHADRVARALPDAWEIAPPSVAIDRRRGAAAEALRRFGVEGPDEYLLQAMFGSVATIAPHGRAMFAANRQIAPTGDPVADLWQWCTTVREHRGDGHVAALAVLGIDGLEATVLLAADLGIDFELFEHPRHNSLKVQHLHLKHCNTLNILQVTTFDLVGFLEAQGHTLNSLNTQQLACPLIKTQVYPVSV